MIRDGVRISEAKIAAVLQWAPPTDYRGVRQFLGFCGHYCHMGRDYAKYTRLLYMIISGENSKKSAEHMDLTHEQLMEFEILKDLIAESICLGFADFTKPFFLETDVSGLAQC